MPLVLPAGLQDAHLMVVKRITNVCSCLGQLGITGAREFFNHPQGFLHSAGIGFQHLGAVGAGLLSGMSEPRSGIGRRGTGLPVTVRVQLSQLLSPVFERDHQVLSVQPEATPVLDHPQPLTGAVEVGIDQPGNTRVSARGDGHPFHGTVGRISCLVWRWRTVDQKARCTFWCGASVFSVASAFSSCGA